MFPQPVLAYVPNQTFPKMVVEEPSANDGRGILQPEQNIPRTENKAIPIPETATDNSPKTVPALNKSGGIAKSGKSVRQTNNLQPTGDIQISMKAKVTAKWGEEYWSAMLYLLDHESGSNPYAVNPKSGACGIPQALPCSKLLKVVGSLDNVDGQLDWIINYIAQRYGDPIKAKAFHQKNNWY